MGGRIEGGGGGVGTASAGEWWEGEGTYHSDACVGFILWDETLKGKALKTEGRGRCVPLCIGRQPPPAPHQAACGSQVALLGKNGGATDLKARGSE